MVYIIKGSEIYIIKGSEISYASSDVSTVPSMIVMICMTLNIIARFMPTHIIHSRVHAALGALFSLCATPAPAIRLSQTRSRSVSCL